MTHEKKWNPSRNRWNSISRRASLKILATLPVLGLLDKLNAENASLSPNSSQNGLNQPKNEANTPKSRTNQSENSDKSEETFFVNVVPIDEEPFSAMFLGFNGENLKFRVQASNSTVPDASQSEISIRKLRSLNVATPNPSLENASLDVNTPNTLESADEKNVRQSRRVVVGESIFHAASVIQKEGKYFVELFAGGRLDALPPGKIQEILFQEEKLGKNQDLDADWFEIQKLETPSDLLVVLRNGKLSYYYGTILEITSKSVRFEQDGESLNVKLKHIFALRFALKSENTQENTPDAPLLGVLADVAGSRICVTEMKLLSDQKSLSIQTTNGEKAEIPFSAFQSLDFTEGRTIWLSSLKPESVKWTPYFQSAMTENSSLQNLTKEFYSPKFDRGFATPQIQLGGKTFSRGLELASCAEIRFRLPAQFKKFQTTLGIDDSVRPGGNAVVKIFADETLLFDETVTGKDSPQILSLDVANARRLTIRVDFGKEGGLSDYVAFADAQLLK